LLAPSFLIISPYKIFCGEFSVLIFRLISGILSIWEKYERAERHKRFICATNWQQAPSAASFLLRVSLAARAEKCKGEAGLLA
jgi:hypothetical protein